MEIYPIMIDDSPAGKLSVERQGARTVFAAECRMLPGVVRISVYGGGREGYLGVLAPEDGMLRLKKTLSRSQMREFPPEIDSVERSGLTPEPKPAPAVSAPPAPAVPEWGEPAADPEPACEAEEEPREEPEREAEAEPAPAEAPETPCAAAGEDSAVGEEEDGEALAWYSSPDGALVCFDGTHNLIALPLGDSRIPTDIPGKKRTVEGREYLVYRTKEGRILR